MGHLSTPLTPRAMENRLKELKLGHEIDRTSCTKFLANQLRVLMSAAAYVLIQVFRLGARRTGCARTQVDTLRLLWLTKVCQLVQPTQFAQPLHQRVAREVAAQFHIMARMVRTISLRPARTPYLWFAGLYPSNTSFTALTTNSISVSSYVGVIPRMILSNSVLPIMNALEAIDHT